jgi:hypothetical protein
MRLCLNDSVLHESGRLESLPMRPVLIDLPLPHRHQSAGRHVSKQIPLRRAWSDIARSTALPGIAYIADRGVTELSGRTVGVARAATPAAGVVHAVSETIAGCRVTVAAVLATASVVERAWVCLRGIASRGGDGLMSRSASAFEGVRIGKGNT